MVVCGKGYGELTDQEKQNVNGVLDYSQWEAPPTGESHVFDDTRTGGSHCLETAPAELAHERELRKVAEARASAIEQELITLESKLQDEKSAAAEAAECAEQQKVIMVAAARQAGVAEGRRQMEQHVPWGLGGGQCCGCVPAVSSAIERPFGPHWHPQSRSGFGSGSRG